MRAVHPRALAIVPALALILFQPGALRPAKDGAIIGNVRDQAGAPIANALVAVVGTAHTAHTNAAGRYELRRIPAGTYTLRAASAGYRTRRIDDVGVRAGATTRQDFSLAAAPVEGQDIVVEGDPGRATRDEAGS